MPGRQLAFDPRDRGATIFVGREEQLALARRRWNASAEGQGHLLLVAGEAGIGKTRLLREFGRSVMNSRRITTSVFPRDIETVGGLLVDLSAELARLGEVMTGTELRERLVNQPAGSGNSSRSRRLLVADLAGIVSGWLEADRVLLFIEDLHWADELSLNVLERVAGSLQTSSSMVIATYRSDELYPHTPLRRMRSRLLEQRLAEEIRLPRLTEDETVRLIHELAGGAQARETVDSVLERSGGIPLFVEELLADTSTSVPTTIADSITQQTASLETTTLGVMQAAAVIGRSFDLDLLVVVAGLKPESVDAALRELVDRNFVLVEDDGSTLDFRHALIRDAVYENIAPLHKRNLHARVASAAVSAGFPDSFISDQYEHAHMAADAYRFALLAAHEASQICSNREAVELFRRAQRTAPGELAKTERATLNADLAEMLAATDDNAAAATQLEAAIELFRSVDDEVSAALLVPRLAAVRHLLGVSHDQRATLLRDELRRVDELDPPAPPSVRAKLLAGLAAVYMLDRFLDDATEAATLAAELAREGGALEELVDIDLTLGSVLVFAGPGADGWPKLELAIGRARDQGFETQAARGYRMLGSCASVLVEYDRALRWIAEGLEYASATEHWNDVHYLNAHLAHVRWATGGWHEARAIASTALEQGRGGVTTRNTALTVLGFLAFGRADIETARAFLSEAREIGESMQELQRLVPPLWGLAETELLAGDHSAAALLAERAYSLSEPIGDAAYIFPFLTTGLRAYIAQRNIPSARNWMERCAALVRFRSIPGTLPAVTHAEGLLLLAEGKTGAARTLLTEAHEGWVERDRYWEAARAAIDLAHCAARSRRPRDAAAILDTVRQRATKMGATAIIALADEVADSGEGAGPLSARELDVARLVASGSTNRQIADQLVISPKTASSHIEHILAKLGAARRSEIAAWIARTET